MMPDYYSEEEYYNFMCELEYFYMEEELCHLKSSN
jgi:hypothetical protein